MRSSDTLHATCASGLQGILRDELVSLGLTSVDARGAGASFGGGLEAGYRACLHSRVANRILLPLHKGVAATPEDLYALVREIDWSAHLDVQGTLAVDFFSADSGITHTQYGALKVKDAVVDQFREASGVRPDVDRDRPDVRINVYVYRDRARIALDLSGASLHRRGYRRDGGPAPLKENVAAALLLAGGWAARAEAGEHFVDPMCGSGTLLVEAALIAARKAPALGRTHFGFTGWRGHDAALWARLHDEAQAAVRSLPGSVRGFDREPAAVAAAQAALQACGVSGDLSVARRDLGATDAQTMRAAATTSGAAATGLIVTNPPWGERLSASGADYQAIGRALSRNFPGWQCAVFTSVSAPLSSLSLPLSPVLEVANGGIDCRLSLGAIPALRGRGPAGHANLAAPAVSAAAVTDAGDASEDERASALDRSTPAAGTAVDVQPVLNRLAKNLRTLKGWRRSGDIRAWRVYDADLPDFACAVDLFDTGEAGDQRHLVVQEYEAPRSVNQALAADRLEAFLQLLPEALDTHPGRVHLKVRRRQRGDAQYRRGGTVSHGQEQGVHGESVDAVTATLHERGARYLLNFSDYLDVGLFIDHRPVRRYVGDCFAQGGRFLNLFAYTSAVSVNAALGGASASVSVDLSNRYVRWSERNLAANGLDPVAHRVVRADVMSWLDACDEAPFDVILLDPPTHSNSTATEQDWDVQNDHARAIHACMRKLAPAGLLIFSNNFRRFSLDASLGDRYAVEDRTGWSIDRDFRRRSNVHHCWFLRHANDIPPA